MSESKPLPGFFKLLRNPNAFSDVIEERLNIQSQQPGFEENNNGSTAAVSQPTLDAGDEGTDTAKVPKNYDLPWQYERSLLSSEEKKKYQRYFIFNFILGIVNTALVIDNFTEKSQSIVGIGEFQGMAKEKIKHFFELANYDSNKLISFTNLGTVSMLAVIALFIATAYLIHTYRLKKEQLPAQYQNANLSDYKTLKAGAIVALFVGSVTLAVGFQAATSGIAGFITNPSSDIAWNSIDLAFAVMLTYLAVRSLQGGAKLLKVLTPEENVKPDYVPVV